MASLLNLSEEELVLFQTLQGSCLLPSLAVPGSGELVQLFKQRKREEDLKKMEPYADLLEDELAKMLNRRKEIILQQLKDSKGTSFTADLFSWNTVVYHEPIWEMDARVAKMTYQERYSHELRQGDREATIKEMKWETTFGTEEAPIYPYTADDMPNWVRSPVKVDRIFRQSDLDIRLSLRLGPNFFPAIRWEEVKHVKGLPRGEGDDGYTVYKKTLYVRYYPFGVKEHELKQLLTVAKKQIERGEKGQRETLGTAEYPVGYSELNILK